MKILALITNNKKITDNIGSFRRNNLEIIVIKENEHISYYLEEYLPEYILFDSEKENNYLKDYLNKNPKTKLFSPHSNKYFKKYPLSINIKKIVSPEEVKKIIETIISLDDKDLKKEELKNSENLKIINQPVISMISIKGGTGSTNVALNIAALASEEYKLKTAFIDFNFSENYSDISSYLKISNQPNLYHYFINYREGFSALNNALSFYSKNGLNIFISPLSSEIINNSNEEIFNSLLFQLKSHYGFIIFDYPINLFSINSFFSSLAELTASFIITAAPTKLCAAKMQAIKKIIKEEKQIYCILNNACASREVNKKEFEKFSDCRVIAEIPHIAQETRRKIIIDNLLTEIIDLRNYLRPIFTNYLAL